MAVYAASQALKQKNFLKGLQLLMNKDMTYEEYTKEDAHYER